MSIISWIVFGFVVGLLARAVLPGRDAMGFVATTILGIVGAVVAGWGGRALGWYPADSGVGIIASVIGAVVVLVAYNYLLRYRSGTSTRIKKNNDRFAA